MFGGDNNNPMFPVFMEENRFHYDANALPQLQLFGNFPEGCTMDPSTFIVKEHAATFEPPAKRGREMEAPVIRQQNNQMSLNNNFRQEDRPPCRILNSTPVSTGLRLSYEEDEHNSSVTSVSESMKGSLPAIFPLGENLKCEIERQKEELDNYIRLQEESFMKGARELKNKHTASFLNAVEKGIGKRLHEKDIEIESMKRRNIELVEKIKQANVEVQSWHYRAKYNESVVNTLRNNLKQVMAQSPMQGKEGFGESEVDDTASYTNQNHIRFIDGPGNNRVSKKMSCKACKVKEVAMLLLPCRHLPLCKDCEEFIEVCPICRVMKTASVEVYMS